MLRALWTAPRVDRHRAGIEDRSRLKVYVVMTDVPATHSALRTAARYTSDLSAEIEILALRIVPYPLSLSHPQIRTDFLKRTLGTSFDGLSGAARLHIVLCRDRVEGLKSAMPERSIVVIGVKHKWWPWPERMLARRLRGMGYEAVLSIAAA